MCSNKKKEGIAILFQGLNMRLKCPKDMEENLQKIFLTKGEYLVNFKNNFHVKSSVYLDLLKIGENNVLK